MFQPVYESIHNRLELTILSSRNAQQLYFKYKCRTTRNARLRKLAIAHFCGDIYFPFIANMHLLHGNNPTLDKVAKTTSQRYTATTAIKLFSVDGLARIVGCDDTACCGLSTCRITLCQHLIIDTFGKRLDAFLLRLCDEPVYICLNIFPLFHLFLTKLS